MEGSGEGARPLPRIKILILIITTFPVPAVYSLMSVVLALLATLTPTASALALRKSYCFSSHHFRVFSYLRTGFAVWYMLFKLRHARHVVT